MRMELSDFYATPIFVPELKRCFSGGRGHTSTTLIVHRNTARTVTPPHFPFVALSAASVGDLSMVPSSSSRPAIAP
jgi:hypothetical protein